MCIGTNLLFINDKYHSILKWVDENYMLGMVYKKYTILQINIQIIIIEFETYQNKHEKLQSN